MTTFQSDTIRKEPAAIIDVTGSMNEQAAPNSPMTKRELATQVMRILAHDLGTEDSQTDDEQGGGGLLTVSFADGIATEVGDLNDTNFESKWDGLHWRGGTYITPAFEMAMSNFQEEFGHLPIQVQPTLALAVLTDGELNDMQSATRWLRNVQGNVYVSVIVIGYGRDHDNAVAQWQNIAEQNHHVQVEAANASTDAHAIASRLLSMLQ